MATLRVFRCEHSNFLDYVCFAIQQNMRSIHILYKWGCYVFMFFGFDALHGLMLRIV